VSSIPDAERRVKKKRKKLAQFAKAGRGCGAGKDNRVILNAVKDLTWDASPRPN